MMQLLLTEMRKMNSTMQDSLTEKICDLDTKFEQRMDSFGIQLANLDSIPGLVKKVEDHEAQIEHLTQELRAVKMKLENALESGLETSLPPEIPEKIVALETRIAEVVSDVQSLRDTGKGKRQDASAPSEENSRLTTELVIGGLAVRPGTKVDVKLLAMAALKVVYPDLIRRDIISARYLSRRSSPRTPATIKPGTQQSDTQQDHQAVNITAGGSQQASATSNTRPPSIAVALGSRALLLEILRSKAALGKLHTSACEPHLPSGLDKQSILPNHVNIHEFLPGPVFWLHNLVRRKAKESSVGFVHFIKNSKIYVRRKKGQPSIWISTEADLDNFLLSLG